MGINDEHITYRVGIEQLDEHLQPIEHIDSWDFYELDNALIMYDGIKPIKNKTAVYIMKTDEIKNEISLIRSKGYKRKIK